MNNRASIDPKQRDFRRKKSASGAAIGKVVKEELPAVAAVSTIAAIPTATTAASPSTVAASATAIATATTTAAGTFRLRPRFVDDEVPAPEALTVQGRDRTIRLFIIGDFDESETTRLTREPIANQTDC